MGHNAFLDPATRVLKAHGFVESNSLGDIKLAVADDFALEPGKWRWDGTTWIVSTPSPPPPNPLKSLITTVVADSAVPPSLKALLSAWQAQL